MDATEGEKNAGGRGRVVLGVAVGLLLLEGAVRTQYTLRSAAEPGYPNINAPGSTVVWGREGHGISRWGDHGVRADAPLPPPPERPTLVLGDSMTEAMQVNDGQSFVALAQARLSSGARSRVHLVNAGHSSFSVADHVLHADRHKRIFSPAWVVIVVEENDFTTDAWNRVKPHFERDAAGRLFVAAGLPESRASRLLSRAANVSSLAGYVYIRGGELRGAVAREPPLFRAADVPESRPSVADEGAEHPVEEELDALSTAYGGRLSILWLSRPPARPPHVAPHEILDRIRAHARSTGVRFVDTTPRFAELVSSWVAPYGFGNLRFNEGHLNSSGHGIVGALLAEEAEALASDALL